MIDQTRFGVSYIIGNRRSYVWKGVALRRLYSTFAGGWPGLGLLLMRLVVGSALLVRASSPLWSAALPVSTTITCAFLLGSAILLISGLWTPIAGTLVASITVGQALALCEDRWTPVLLGTIAGALAMLGPGLWSVDARLFGWKRLDPPPRKSSFTDR